MVSRKFEKVKEFTRGFLTAGIKDREDLRKVIIINGTGIFVLLSALFWTLVDWLYLGRPLNALVDGVGFLIGLFVLWGLRRSRNVDLFSKAYVTLLTVVLLTLNSLMGVSSSNTFWLFLVPAASFFVGGERLGLFWTTLVFIWLSLSFLLGYFDVLGEYVSFEFALDLLSAYFLVSIFLLFYEQTRKQTQLGLKEAKDFSEDIINHAPLGIYTINSGGIIESLNPAMEQIAGDEGAGEKVGVNVFELESYQESGLGRFLKEALVTGNSFEVKDLGYTSKSTGKSSIRHYRGIPLKDEHGKVIRLLLLVEDVTALREVEEGREILIQELSHKNEELERFVYVVSHDLRSPLTSLRGYLDEVRSDVEEGNEGQLNKDLESMEKIATNMGQMIDDLLALSRVGREEYEKEVVDFNKLVGEVLDNFAIQVKEKGFTVKVESGMPTLKVYRRPMEEVFSNLISNAIKFTEGKSRPRIEIGARDKGEDYHFFVKDNGVGVPASVQRQLFNLFFRHGRKAGTGIGLSIVKEYVQMHDGRVWVESEEGAGSTFWFSLPKV